MLQTLPNKMMKSLVFIFSNLLYLKMAYITMANEHQSCKLNIEGCNYKLTLVPSDDQCQGHNQTRSRSQRAVTNSNSEIAEILQELKTTSERYKKLEYKLTKDMKQLGKRVLRGARKLETMIKKQQTTDTRSGVKDCPQGFIVVDNWLSCYMISTFNTSMYEAREICLALGSDLVSLETSQEHHLLSYLVRNNPTNAGMPGWWTSGTFITATKQWMWTPGSDPRPVTYRMWAPKEPNEEHALDLLCLMMLRLDNLQWHDQLCTDHYNFICEKSLA
ncbi:lectin BRA-2-like [Dreissena polymorpha]|nr:lectin BRA-2-like [Dreissena polymorpha]